MKPTDDKLEAMAVRWSEAQKLYEDAGVFGTNGADLCRASAAMLRACKTGDAPDHAEWNAAIEAAVDKLNIYGDLGGMEIVLSLKKGPPQ